MIETTEELIDFVQFIDNHVFSGCDTADYEIFVAEESVIKRAIDQQYYESNLKIVSHYLHSDFESTSSSDNPIRIVQYAANILKSIAASAGNTEISVGKLGSQDKESTDTLSSTVSLSFKTSSASEDGIIIPSNSNLDNYNSNLTATLVSNSTTTTHELQDSTTGDSNVYIVSKDFACVWICDTCYHCNLITNAYCDVCQSGKQNAVTSADITATTSQQGRESSSTSSWACHYCLGSNASSLSR